MSKLKNTIKINVTQKTIFYICGLTISIRSLIHISPMVDLFQRFYEIASTVSCSTDIIGNYIEGYVDGLNGFCNVIVSMPSHQRFTSHNSVFSFQSILVCPVDSHTKTRSAKHSSLNSFFEYFELYVAKVFKPLQHR